MSVNKLGNVPASERGIEPMRVRDHHVRHYDTILSKPMQRIDLAALMPDELDENGLGWSVRDLLTLRAHRP